MSHVCVHVLEANVIFFLLKVFFSGIALIQIFVICFPDVSVVRPFILTPQKQRVCHNCNLAVNCLGFPRDSSLLPHRMSWEDWKALESGLEMQKWGGDIVHQEPPTNGNLSWCISISSVWGVGYPKAQYMALLVVRLRQCCPQRNRLD